MSRSDRGQGGSRPWYLLTGLILGLGIGLIYAWVVSPIRYVDTAPYSLQAEYKDQYRILVAQAYAANGDLGRARARLDLLRDDDSAQELAAQAQRALSQGGDPGLARPLALLAASLSGQAPAVTPAAPASPPAGTAVAQLDTSATPPAASPTPALTEGTPQPTLDPVRSVTPTREPTATITPTLTVTPQPTRTPTPTQGPPFVLSSLEEVCVSGRLSGLLQVEVLDAAGTPVPGVRVVVTWPSGQNTFYTGLAPEISLGYADFQMDPDVAYTLRLDDGGELVRDLTLTECRPPEGGDPIWGGWKAVFQQPVDEP